MAEPLIRQLEQEEEEVQQTRMLRALYDDAFVFRKGLSEKWDKHLAWLRGEQEIKERPKMKSNTVTNFLFSEIMTIVPILTSSPPNATYKSERNGEVFPGAGVEWEELEEELARLTNRIFARNSITQRNNELVLAGASFGKGYIKYSFDREMYGGHGDIRLEVPDTRSIFLEPGKMLLNDMNYIFEVTALDELTLLRKYPNKRDRIKEMFAKEQKSAESAPATISKSPDDIVKSANAPGSSSLTSSVGAIWDMGMKDKSRKREVELIEAWFHDDEMVETAIDIRDDQGNLVTDKRSGRPKQEKRISKKFPNGRLIQFAGSLVFQDHKNKFPGFPYVEYWNYQLPGMQYGMSELDQTVPIQEQYNIRNNQLYDLLNYNLGPLRLHDASANLDPDLYTNAPNLLLQVGNVNGFKQIDPPQISMAAFNTLEMIKKNIETVFGVREVTQGTIPSDIRSGAAIEALQEAADVRLRMKTRSLEATFKELARCLINMIAKFYVPGVHYDERFAKVIPKMHGDMFDIEILAGVNLPRSRVAQQQMMQWMFGQGIVDEVYIVNHSQLEDKEDLIERQGSLWEARRQMLQNQAAGTMPPSGTQEQQ